MSFFIFDNPWDEDGDRVEVLGKRTYPPSDEDSSEMMGPLYMRNYIARATLATTLKGLLSCVASGNVEVRNTTTW